MTQLVRAIVLLIFAQLVLGSPAQAAWPERPITIIVPWGAGGAADRIARALATELEQDLKQPVNVVNHTGGSGVFGHSAILAARPDGYTFGIATVEITMLHHQKLAPFTHKDFTVAAIVNSDAGGLLVRADSPYKSARQLLDDIKANPPQTFKASGSGQGSIWHLGLVGWLIEEGVDPKRVTWIPSQGSAPSMQELVEGNVDFVTSSLPEGKSFMDAGKARGLAHMDMMRWPQDPHVPTLKEATGSNWTILAWRAVVGPKGIPKEIMNRFLPALQKAHQGRAFRDFMNERGFGWAWMGPAESMRLMDVTYANSGRIMRQSGMIQ